MPLNEISHLLFHGVLHDVSVLIRQYQIVGPERIDFDLAELACTDMVLEEYIEIRIGETLGLGQAEVCL